jgi:hypothetical protein
VQHQSHRYGAFAALMLAVTLSGCGDVNTFDSNERWFAKPFDWSGANGGYSFSELQETQKRQQPVTAASLVDANGGCPAPPSAPAPVAPPTTADAQGPGVMPVAPASDSLLGQGVALGMSECDVVYRAGAPSSVQIGAGPNGTRTAVLTFNSGPRSGIYRFEGGRLMDMDGVQTAADAPQPAPKKVARKKRAPVQSEQVSTE